MQEENANTLLSTSTSNSLLGILKFPKARIIFLAAITILYFSTANLLLKFSTLHSSIDEKRNDIVSLRSIPILKNKTKWETNKSLPQPSLNNLVNSSVHNSSLFRDEFREFSVDNSNNHSKTFSKDFDFSNKLTDQDSTQFEQLSNNFINLKKVFSKNLNYLETLYKDDSHSSKKTLKEDLNALRKTLSEGRDALGKLLPENPKKHEIFSENDSNKPIKLFEGSHENSESPFEEDSNTDTFVPRKRNKNKHNLSYILYWRKDFGIEKYGWKTGRDLGGCVVTYNRSKLKDAEAVVFHYTALDEENMPWQYYRDEDQLFVFTNHESPSYMMWGEHRHEFPKFDGGFINLTNSYRSDASIFDPYLSNLKGILKQGRNWVNGKIAAKRNVALWIVSNCDLVYGSLVRMEISDALVRAGLPIHRYGKCFSNKYAIDSLEKKSLDSYRFYMAFENSLHCKDYMTEKFWEKGILAGRVPVVWGPSKEDVVRLAPTKSFIHYEDFDSPADLASYLLYLNGNDTAYREYFDWVINPDQKTKDLVQFRRSGQIKLCEIIKTKRRKRSVIKSVTNFFLNESFSCLRPKSFNCH